MPQLLTFCPVCNSRDLRTIGPILHPCPALVAGIEIDLGDTEYWLRACRKCEFQFKDPTIPEEKLMANYAQANSANWEIDPNPLSRQFDLIRNTLEVSTDGRRVLDVGCFNG